MWVDFAEIFDGFTPFGAAPMGVFTFVVLLALIGGVTSWMKTRAVQETVREAIRAGTPLDPMVIRELKGEDGARQSHGLTGLILLAVAAALAVFGFAVSRAGGDEAPFTVFLGIAAFPGLVGLAFLMTNRGGNRAQEGP